MMPWVIFGLRYEYASTPDDQVALDARILLTSLTLAIRPNVSARLELQKDVSIKKALAGKIRLDIAI